MRKPVDVEDVKKRMMEAIKDGRLGRNAKVSGYSVKDVQAVARSMEMKVTASKKALEGAVIDRLCKTQQLEDMGIVDKENSVTANVTTTPSTGISCTLLRVLQDLYVIFVHDLQLLHL